MLHRSIGTEDSNSSSSDDDCGPPTKQSRLQSRQEIASFATLPSRDKASMYQLITNCFVPESEYKFPKSACGRSFQHQWLVRYPWLKYSKQEDGGLCLPCVLFAKSATSFGSDPGGLVTTPLTNFKHALKRLGNHAEYAYHKTAVVRMDEFVKVMRGKQPDIRSQLDAMTATTIASNRQKLRSIIETVLLCGRQNIALRGHRDSGLDFEHDESASHGNFWALLQFRIAAGDSVLRDHLAHAPKNATYTSPDIQNQVISVLSDHVRDKILSRVRQAQYFTLMADEVTDCSNKEQLSIVLRYVDPDSKQIREDFVSFVECDTGCSGRALADKMLCFFHTHGLDLTKLRGQSYDGAGNMSGKTNGAAALISVEYPLAHYLHCASHCLNLAVVKSLDETNIRNMMGVIDRVSIFFHAHPKRQRKLEDAIGSTQPESTVRKLKDLCRTRWIQRIDALDKFQALHPSIVVCMENITDDGSRLWSSDSLTDARTLLLAITTTGFLSALVVTNGCMQYLLGLTCSLQAEAKDIVQAVAEINHVLTTLQDVRKNVAVHHSKWFAKVEQMCEDLSIQPALPRRCARQQHRSNVPAQNVSDYYQRVVTIPLLDHLVSGLEARFSKHQQTALQGLFLVPSILTTKTIEEVTPKILQLGSMYERDIPFFFQAWKVSSIAGT